MVVTATSVTRKIANGVTARVVRDTVTLDGEIIEDTLDWYAQDQDGTVWYLGEDTAEFENGKITTREGSFEAGVDGAQAGVIMPASPEVGMAYRQEYYEGEAEDNGEVLALSEQASVPAGDYDDLVKTADTTPLEPDVLEHKYYARGVGLVLTIDKEAGGREELLSVTQVPPAQARRAGRGRSWASRTDAGLGPDQEPDRRPWGPGRGRVAERACPRGGRRPSGQHGTTDEREIRW